MFYQRLRVSLVFLLMFCVLVGAKAQKRAVKKLTPFEKLRKEYLVYKNSNKSKAEDVLNSYRLKFQKFVNSNRIDEGVQSLYYTGDIYEKLYELTKKEDFLNDAYSIYQKLSRYNNSFGLAAQKKVAILKPLTVENEKWDSGEKETEDKKPEDLKEAAPKAAPVSLIKLNSIKYWSSEEYTRVVIELPGEAVYEHKMLKEDLESAKPKRIFVDVKNAVFSDPSQLAPVTVKDNLLEQIRVGQFQKDVLRVVLDLKSLGSYKIFALREPFRIVIDIYGKELKDKGTLSEKKEDKKLQEAVFVSKDLKYNVKRIVLDGGHGAHDPGAIGHKGLKEKDVVLDIVLRLGKLVKDNFPDMDVIYTRDSDFFLSLEERTAVANTKKADLFISVHANASKKKSSEGIETYFLNFAKEERAMEVAARENATTLQGVDEVQTILRDLIVSSKYNESSMLASFVQKNLVDRISREYADVIDLGVKQGPFYVLIGAAMPSILVETSFISNPKEGARLADGKYRQKLAEGIFEGVREYILKTAVSSVR